MYNEVFKFAYMNDLQLKESSINQYITIFNSTAKTEKEMNKDLFEMSFDELELVFRNAHYRRVNSLINYITVVKSYVTWAIDNNYSSSNILDFIDNINEESVSKYVYKKNVRYFTRDELLESLNNLINVQHQALVLALFEGVRGQGFSEIINLKYDDILREDGKYYLNLLSDEIDLIYRDVQISDELFILLDKTYHKKEIYSASGRVNRVSDGEYVFRKARTGDGSVKLTDGAINMIMTKYIKDAFENTVVNANYIYHSGMMYKINKLMGDKKFLTKDIAAQIIEEYNLGFQFLGGRKYPVYANLRRLIDEKFMKEAYGEFKSDI